MSITIIKHMKKISYFGFVLSILFFASCQNKQQQQQQGAAAMPYPVIEVPNRTVTAHTSYPVSIEATLNSAVRAKVSGYITLVLVDEGRAVKKGQTLFRIETEALSQDAGAAQANINAAQIEVARLRPLVEKNRSEERRVGKECRTGWRQCQDRKKSIWSDSS